MARRPALSRGIGDLMAEVAADLPTATPGRAGGRTVPITSLEPNPFQPRQAFDGEELEGLADSIRGTGVLQPLLVRPHPASKGSFQILAGERRWRAAQKAKLHEVPVVVREADDREAAAVAVIENVQRSDLNPIEEAGGYRRLVEEFGLKQEEAARVVGKSRPQVANRMRLLGLPDEVQAMIVKGTISAGHGIVLLQAKDPADLARQVAAKDLNVRETERLVAAGAGRDDVRRRPPRKDPNIAALERRLEQALGLEVRIRDRGGRGDLRVAYARSEQLEDLVRRLERDS